MFKKDEEVFDWCCARNIGEEDVLGEVSEWVRKESFLGLTRHCDSREDAVWS